jgi:hypothetical protein
MAMRSYCLSTVFAVSISWDTAGFTAFAAAISVSEYNGFGSPAVIVSPASRGAGSGAVAVATICTMSAANSEVY